MSHLPQGGACPLISVLVPVYNAKDRLLACINSIRAQTWQNLEILLVDDGSTDGGGTICDDLAAADARIRVVHQENQGTWAARNLALELAKGDYISWVDDDDMVFPVFLQSLYEQMQQQDTKIAMCRFEDGVETSLPLQPKDAVEADCVMDFGQYANALQGIRELEMIALWNKLYKRELWEGVRFVTGSFVDDGYVVWKIVYKAGSIAVSTRPLYLYYSSPNTVSRNSQYRVRGVRNADCLAERYLFFKKQGYRWPAGMTLRRCYESIASYGMALGKSDSERRAQKELRKVFFRLLPNALASPYFGKKAKLYLMATIFAPKKHLPSLFQLVKR